MILLAPTGTLSQSNSQRSDLLLVGTVDGVSAFVRAADGEWQLRNRGLEGTFVSSLTLLEDGTVVAGTHGLGLARSDDGGLTWNLINRGMTVYDIWVVKALVVQGRERLYAGTLPARVFVSDDRGENWRELDGITRVPRSCEWMFPPPPHVAHVLDFAALFDRLLVGIEVGALLRSDDLGETFVDMALDPDVTMVDIHALAVHPERPRRIVAATGLWGVIRSEDGGVTWDKDIDLPGIDYPVPMVIHPSQPDTLFIAGGMGFPPHWYKLGRSRARIARSLDGGKTWQRLLAGLPDGQRPCYGALAVESWPGGSAVYAVDSDGTVYESLDNGDAWRVVADTPPVSKGEQYRGLAKNRPQRMTGVDALVFSKTGQRLIDNAA